MIVSYPLEKDALLTFQLFAASRSPRIRRQRLFGWLIIPFLALAIAVLEFFGECHSAASSMAIMGLTWALLYPFFSRWYYKRHYRKHVEEYSSPVLGMEVQLSLQADGLILKDKGAETRVDLGALASLHRIKGYGFILFPTGQGITLPESYLGVELDRFMQSLAKKSGLPLQQSDWKWK